MLGAVVAPTDTVAAVSVFKRLGAPPRVATTLEGESLVNGGIALALFGIGVAVVACPWASGPVWWLLCGWRAAEWPWASRSAGSRRTRAAFSATPLHRSWYPCRCLRCLPPGRCSRAVGSAGHAGHGARPRPTAGLGHRPLRTDPDGGVLAGARVTSDVWTRLTCSQEMARAASSQRALRSLAGRGSAGVDRTTRRAPRVPPFGRDQLHGHARRAARLGPRPCEVAGLTASPNAAD